MTLQQVKLRYGIVGNSKALNTAIEMAVQVAPTEVSVLITGENGTGKDVFSRIIHDNSKRKHKKLIAINTGAIPEGTLDSELFGHEKGSFTSAYEARKGYFEEVEGGTIFMDEIGEMPLSTQAKLLRLLENGDYLRVGSSKVLKADVRVIAATNKNLLDQIRHGKFREDLYFRLNTITIQVPPLRERGEDIIRLFEFFSHEFAEKYRREPFSLEPEAIQMLTKYRWPGNVRELKNMTEKLCLLVKGDLISEEILRQHLPVHDNYLPSIIPQTLDDYQAQNGFDQDEKSVLYSLIYNLGKEIAELKKLIYPLVQPQDYANPTVSTVYPGRPAYYPEVYNEAEVAVTSPPNPIKKELPRLEESLSLTRKEKEMILKALNKHGNNRKRAAVELGISERTLYRKIKAYDIEI